MEASVLVQGMVSNSLEMDCIEGIPQWEAFLELCLAKGELLNSRCLEPALLRRGVRGGVTSLECKGVGGIRCRYGE
jgi:hypothetical protein